MRLRSRRVVIHLLGPILFYIEIFRMPGETLVINSPRRLDDTFLTSKSLIQVFVISGDATSTNKLMEDLSNFCANKDGLLSDFWQRHNLKKEEKSDYDQEVELSPDT